MSRLCRQSSRQEKSTGSTQNWPAPVYDISDVMKNADAAPVGKAWITRSGKAVMILINGVQFVSPLAQVKGMLSGERKYANVSVMCEVPSLATTHTTGRGGLMTTIFDAMPLKVLEELERIETTITDKEHQAFMLQANAQDLRIRHDEIIAIMESPDRAGRARQPDC